VTLAASASEALLHLARGSFDVILCDVHMPGLDGPSFAGKLAPLDSAKVVFITGGGWGDVEKDILATRPVLRKPFCRDEMLAVMVAVAAA
jgi:two-component system NtrC family sensor kinase